MLSFVILSDLACPEHESNKTTATRKQKRFIISSLLLQQDMQGCELTQTDAHSATIA